MAHMQKTPVARDTKNTRSGQVAVLQAAYAETMNCRCTLVAAIEGFERDLSDMAQRRGRLPEGMTYEQWKAEGLAKPQGNYRLTTPKRSVGADIIDLDSAFPEIRLPKKEYAKVLSSINRGFITSQIDTAPKRSAARFGLRCSFITSQIDTAPKPNAEPLPPHGRFITSQIDTAPKRERGDGRVSLRFITSQIDTAPKHEMGGVARVAGFITSQIDTAPKRRGGLLDGVGGFITSQIDTAPKRNEAADADEHVSLPVRLTLLQNAAPTPDEVAAVSLPVRLTLLQNRTR